MKPGTFTAPVPVPVSDMIVPPVSPAKDPVSSAPGVLVKVGLNTMLLASTFTLPAMFASPVTASARAEPALKKTAVARRPANREPLNFIFAKSLLRGIGRKCSRLRMHLGIQNSSCRVRPVLNHGGIERGI